MVRKYQKMMHKITQFLIFSHQMMRKKKKNGVKISFTKKNNEIQSEWRKRKVFVDFFGWLVKNSITKLKIYNLS